MEAIRDIQKKYCSAAMGLAILVGLALILMGQKPAGKGLVLGTLFSTLNFILMGQSLPLQLGRAKRAATAVSLGSIGLRYLLLAIPLVVALRFDGFDPIAAAVGIFMIQIVIFADHLYGVLGIRQGK